MQSTDLGYLVRFLPSAPDEKNSVPKLVRLDVPLETVAPFFRDGTEPSSARIAQSPMSTNPDAALLQLVVQALHNVGEQKLYNSAARSWIANNHLQIKETLDGQLRTVGSMAIDQRMIAPFPRESIIVKAKWESITNKGPNDVWYWNYGSTKNWEHGCFRKVTVRKAGNTEPCNLPLNKSAVVKSTCFYSVNDDGEPENSLILWGLHVMTKEISDWTWSTFWWSPNSVKIQVLR